MKGRNVPWKPLPIPAFGRRSEAVSNALRRTAGNGLLRRFPVGQALNLGLDLWFYYNNRGPGGPSRPASGWNTFADCGRGPGAEGHPTLTSTGCASFAFWPKARPGGYASSVGHNQYYELTFHSSANATHDRMTPHRIFTRQAGALTEFGMTVGGLAPQLGGEGDEDPDARQRSIDPLSARPGIPQPGVAPEVPPYGMLPHRGFNPDRSPQEQTHRGSQHRPEPGAVPGATWSSQGSVGRPSAPWAWPAVDPGPAPLSPAVRAAIIAAAVAAGLVVPRMVAPGVPSASGTGSGPVPLQDPQRGDGEGQPADPPTPSPQTPGGSPAPDPFTPWVRVQRQTRGHPLFGRRAAATRLILRPGRPSSSVAVRSFRNTRSARRRRGRRKRRCGASSRGRSSSRRD